MASTTDPARADQQGLADPWLWTEQVCDRLGITPRTWHKMVSESRARTAQGLPLEARHAPLPDDYAPRQVHNGHHWVTLPRAPRWRRSTVDAWVAARPGRAWAKDQPSPLRGKPSPRKGRPTHARTGEEAR